MAIQPLQELTTEALDKRIKKVRSANIVLVVCVLLMAASSLYLTTFKGITFNTFLPLFFLPMVLVNYMNLKKLQQERAKR